MGQQKGRATVELKQINRNYRLRVGSEILRDLLNLGQFHSNHIAPVHSAV